VPAATALQRPLAQVRVAAVAKENFQIFLTGIGTVQGYNSVAVTTRVDGHIVQVLFNEGQDVAKGDPLVIIDARPFQAQLDQQLAMLQKDEAVLAGALLDMTRYDTLLQKSFATQQQVDQQRALVEQNRAQVRNDKALIEYAKSQLEYTTIRAPISGRIGIRLIDQGNVVRASDAKPIAVIVQLQPISVIFTLPAGALAKTKLEIGRVDASVTAFAQDNQTELDQGTVEIVDNYVDPASGTIKVKATFPNKRSKLWPGDFVNGRITVDNKPDAMTIPFAGLRHGPRGDFVWMVQKDHTVKAVGITAGQISRGRVLVESGLTPGQQVVVDGYYGLENGTKVEIDETKKTDNS